jgi:exodeoxyribonuclease-5
MERGNLVHAVLAKYWQGHDAAYLQDSIPETLRAELLGISQAVLEAFNTERDHAFSETFLSLEAERLSKLVYAWQIEVEMLRPQGFEVQACEEEHNIEIEGIGIKLIIDRIDTLDDGRLLVIDYKTGRQLDYKNWAQPNITEPQLPIYAAFILQAQDGDTSEIGAVCYAKVSSADHEIIGIAATDELVQGVVVFDDKRGRKIFDETSFSDWQSIITHWKSTITATAISLKSGDAAVRFEDEKQLAFCDITPLLRLPERQLQFERKNKGTA